jgi:hypothetical protein
LRLTLDETITLARRQSVNAAVALNELKTAYWEYRSYKADLLPEMSLSGTIPAYNKRYNTYQREDGGYSYVRNDYMQMDGALSIKQNIWLTGGTLSINSSLNFLRQMTGGDPDNRNQYMSVPVALTLNQPIFGVNTLSGTAASSPCATRRLRQSSSPLRNRWQCLPSAISSIFCLRRSE